MLAREVFDAAMDTIRFPRVATADSGAWTPSKFYRARRFNPVDASLVVQTSASSVRSAA